MTKKDFVHALSKKLHCTDVAASKFTDAFLALASETLAKGEDLSFRDFGALKVKGRAARTINNFNKRVKVEIPARKVVKFEMGKALDDLMKQL